MSEDDASSPWLTYASRDHTARARLVAARTVVGRASDCDLSLPVMELSRHHFAVEREADGWVVVDLQSRFGTFLNGQRVERARLADLDRLTVGAPGFGQGGFLFHREEHPAAVPLDTVLIQDTGRLSGVGAVIDVADRLTRDTEALDRPPSSPESRVSSRHSLSPESRAAQEQLGLIALLGKMGDALLSSGSLEELLRQVLDLAFDHIPAERGSVLLCDGSGGAVVPVAARQGRSHQPIRVSRSVLDEVVKQCHALLVPDAQEDERFRGSDSVIGLGIRSVLCAPMYHRGQVLGLIYLETGAREPGGGSRFTARHLDLLAAIAVFAAAGVDRARLKQEFHREQQSGLAAHGRIHVLLEVAKALSSELNTEALIEVIMIRARELVDAERCTLFLRDERTGELWSKVAEGTGEIRVPVTKGLAGHVATTGEVVNIRDAYADARFNPEVDRLTGFRTRSILAMPLRNTEGRVVGVTQMINKRGDAAFTAEDEQLLQAFSAQAAVALENAKLFQETLAMRNHLESILNSITNVVLTLDTDGRLVTANRPVENLLGIADQRMRDRPFREWFDGGNEAFVEDVARVYREPAPVFAADFAFQSGASAVSANYSIVPLLDFERRQTGVVIVLDDITMEKRMRATLGRYMAPALAEQVLRSDQDRLGGVRQKVSVLFSDIRGYTSFAESMDASEVVELLNEYFGYMVDAVDAEEGVLDKFIGDAIMALFGVPFPREDDAARACRTALRMRRQLREFNARRAGQGSAAIQIGVGINTGLAVSGNIGSMKRSDYTCIGDAVNLGSRLEGASKAYGVTILLSQFTHEEIAGRFLTRELDLIRVKGKQQSLRLYELLGAGDEDAPAALLRALPRWEAGLEQYRRQNWDAALGHFARVAEDCGDPASRMFIERCRAFRERPPAPGWDGTWELTGK